MNTDNDAGREHTPVGDPARRSAHASPASSRALPTPALHGGAGDSGAGPVEHRRTAPGPAAITERDYSDSMAVGPGIGGKPEPRPRPRQPHTVTLLLLPGQVVPRLTLPVRHLNLERGLVRCDRCRYTTKQCRCP